jgi:hypothetical protein
MQKEELSAALAAKLFNVAHQAAKALVEIHFLLFESIFSLIL